jgi:prepilin-type N-terminal cleavage/methylation domain-containing protein
MKMKKAFTLMELLVVISIIGMLSSIVLVSMGGARARARDAKRQSDLRQIVSAMELAYDDSATECGGPNSYIVSGNFGSTSTITTAIPKICTNTGQYLNPTPNDPVASRNYVWFGNNGTCGSLNAGQWYCIYAILEADGVVVASQRGVRVTTTLPTNCNCGW